ncbi:glucan 1,4-alpha-glucosidase [Deinococcus metallilatus]|uniref:Glucan 1,4-alpha-glucosidase n=1 Tax=Deinococcus metallilatus TaxID=1211322 RepID=A0AAJ5F1J2_9DEIO|nr:glycoside hydrolase family 15 protein [Deinococcus metallilatus]MBB5295337.1 glucoamylase [Deinococcus metallilatus]QBY08510.1 glucan 1,4-alpha-glucosidase [Deinococcus metallilatus]RXJ11020.1 glucan 1,4-alpha-glucosidase [Deinococcus metallilatus]TLK21602.1 glucan 1,4-alpha-glucosidase [Deinococcus metallilatus]GMA15112.1 glucan 1,4-alpha-glucosidase [Deinococcus metallilatus]
MSDTPAQPLPAQSLPTQPLPIPPVPEESLPDQTPLAQPPSAQSLAPGAPGLPPTWTSSDKDFVTTALGGASRLWATGGHGMLNEVYWPSTGQPQIRDLNFYLVGESGWVDLKRVQQYVFSRPKPYLPLPTVLHRGQDYQLALEVLPDPNRDVLLIRYALTGPYRLVLLLAPHLTSTGHANAAWVEGQRLLAVSGDRALALLASGPLDHLSAGYVGFSDGWQDLNAHGRLTWSYQRAENGNVALTAELQEPSGLLALGFAENVTGAQGLARASLAEGDEVARRAFLHAWEVWGSALKLGGPSPELDAEALLSATVLKIHEDRAYPGALVASLSIPWGNSTDTLGGYHLVWPRDATLAAFALIACNQREDARRVLAWFIANQQADGHWLQNYYPDGQGFWHGIQLDETAFPVLLAAKLREEGEPELEGTRDMVRRALAFVARTGPTSDQDRWEENQGVNPFTLAVAIAALVAGAGWLEENERHYALGLADDWNERLESLCYVTGTPLCQELNVQGYYVRLAPPDRDGTLTGQVTLQNRQGKTVEAAALVSMDFSYLPRLGLRSALDPRIRDTVKVVDHLLAQATPTGTFYHRYNDDGYGEHEDGSPYDGHGIGRLWPLLSGERGHLALQAGEDSRPYLETLLRCSSPGGLLPEQVWDGPPIPERGLFPGRPNGSAMPLLWAHAEFLKLLHASQTGRPAELLREVENRYAEPLPVEARHWRPAAPVPQLEPGRLLLIEDDEPFTLHFGFDGWQDPQDREALPLPFGLWGVTFSPAELTSHHVLNFTRRSAAGWEGQDHQIRLQQSVPTSLPERRG